MFDLGRLGTVAKRVNFRPGAVIVREGDTVPQVMYIISGGEVVVFKSYKQKNEALLATLGRGSLLGEMSLFLGRPRVATVIAKTPVGALEITKGNMDNIMKEFPDMPYKIMDMAFSRLKESGESGGAAIL